MALVSLSLKCRSRLPSPCLHHYAGQIQSSVMRELTFCRFCPHKDHKVVHVYNKRVKNKILDLQTSAKFMFFWKITRNVFIFANHLQNVAGSGEGARKLCNFNLNKRPQSKKVTSRPIEHGRPQGGGNRPPLEFEKMTSYATVTYRPTKYPKIFTRALGARDR